MADARVMHAEAAGASPNMQQLTEQLKQSTLAGLGWGPQHMPAIIVMTCT